MRPELKLGCPQCSRPMTTAKSLDLGLCSRCRKLAKPLAEKAGALMVDPPKTNSAEIMEMVGDHVTRFSGISGDAEKSLYAFLKDRRPQLEAFMQVLATHSAGRLAQLMQLVQILESELFRPERLLLMPAADVLRALEYVSRSMTAAIEFVQKTNDRADTSWAQAVEERLRGEQVQGARDMTPERRERIVSLTQSLGKRLRSVNVEPTDPVI